LGVKTIENITLL